MFKFNVYRYPEMVLHIHDIQADDARQTITKAIAATEADRLDAGGDADKSRLCRSLCALCRRSGG